jgi:G:T-mismatch repair DNA endonuclease (very short patch repair protein)
MPMSSKFEDRIAAWLDSKRIGYQRQFRVRFWVVDFKLANGTIIEAQGCYWHGCPCKGKPTPAARKRARKDKGLATYCANHGIPLVTIWEHEDLHQALTSRVL